MKRFECNPYIYRSDIGEVEVEIFLNDEELNAIKGMSEDEYKKFILSKATTTVSDFEVDFDIPPIEEWDEIPDRTPPIEEHEKMKADIVKLKKENENLLFTIKRAYEDLAGSGYTLVRSDFYNILKSKNLL